MTKELSSYNERKLSVLEALEDLVDANTMEVADYIGISYDAARLALSRYHYQGLLNRQKGIYTLSDSGVSRLNYLRQDT